MLIPLAIAATASTYKLQVLFNRRSFQQEVIHGYYTSCLFALFQAKFVKKTNSKHHVPDPIVILAPSSSRVSN